LLFQNYKHLALTGRRHFATYAGYFLTALQVEKVSERRANTIAGLTNPTML